MAIQSVITKSHLRDYSDIEPLPDPPQVPDMEQFDGISAFAWALGSRCKRRDGYLVSGGGYLRSDAQDNGDFAPDITFAENVGDVQRIVRRNGYVISEVGKPPDLVLEVGSRSTGRRDYTVKREGYARYGVREYWRFDPSGGAYHDAPLGGDSLVDGEYEPIEIVSESETRHWGYSEVLGLEIWWYEGLLRLRDPVTGEFLHGTPEESQDAVESERTARESAERHAEAERMARESAERHAESERAERESAERRAETERAAREAERVARESAEARMAEMEEELRRLQGG